MNCVCCKTPLNNSVDTFGDVGQEMCWACWSGLWQDMICRVFVAPQDIWGLSTPSHVISKQEVDDGKSIQD